VLWNGKFLNDKIALRHGVNQAMPAGNGAPRQSQRHDGIVVLSAGRSVAQQPRWEPFSLIGHQFPHQHRIVHNEDLSSFEG
jgi:hypothetical protein